MENVHPSEDDRSVSDDNLRFTARMQQDGNGCLVYMLDWKCYTKDEKGKLTSQRGYPCQYLQVSDSCIVYHVHYELSVPLCCPMPWLVGPMQGNYLYIVCVCV